MVSQATVWCREKVLFTSLPPPPRRTFLMTNCSSARGIDYNTLFGQF